MRAAHHFFRANWSWCVRGPHLVRVGQETTLHDGWLDHGSLPPIKSIKSESNCGTVCILRHRSQLLLARLSFLLSLKVVFINNFTVFDWRLTNGRFRFRVKNVFLSSFGWRRGIGPDSVTIVIRHTIKCRVLVSLQNGFVELYLVRVIEIWCTSTVIHMNVWCYAVGLVIVHLLDSCSRLYFHFFLYFWNYPKSI